jgi:hypothetical protein
MVLTARSGDWFEVLEALCKGFAPHFELFSTRLRAERVALLRTAQNAVAAPPLRGLLALHGCYAACLMASVFIAGFRFGR